MKRIMCTAIILLTILLSSCSMINTNIPGIGQLGAESDYNIKIYTDVDVDYKIDGSIMIDDTTIFYLNSDATEGDMDQIRQIFGDRYEVYKGLK